MFNCGPSRGTWGKTRHLVFNSLLYVEFFRKILNVGVPFLSQCSLHLKLFTLKYLKILLKSKKLSEKKTEFVPSYPHDGVR